MKRPVLSLAAILSLTVLAFAKDRTFTGEIMDNQCSMNGSHAQMEKMKGMSDDSRMCTLKCVEMGGKFVLYDAARKMAYQLDDQQKAKEFAGQKVKVTGTYDKTSKTVHVAKIEAAS